MGNKSYAKKLKERREAEQRKIIEKRKARNNPSNRVEVDLTKEQKPTIEKVKSDADISKEAIAKTIEEGAVNTEKVKKISDAPPDETDEEKKTRLLKVRKEIYDKHLSAIDTKYQEGKQTIANKKKEEIKSAEEEHNKTIEGHKSDLNETLEDNDDPSDRRDARQNYRENVAEEEEAHKDNLLSIADEYKESFNSLKDEFNTKKDDLLQQYEDDIVAIKDETYTDADLELCQKEFEAETITFEALDEYESDDDYSSSSDYSHNHSSFSFMRLAIGAIGLGIVLMVGYMVVEQVGGVLQDAGQYNATSVGVSNIIPSVTSPMFVMLVLAPIFLFIIPMLMRTFRGGYI